MPVCVEFDGASVRRWTLDDGGGATATLDEAYAPTCYVAGPPEARAALRATLAEDPKVAGLSTARRFRSLRADEREAVLRVDCERVDEVRALAGEVKRVHERGSFPVGTFELFDVDLSPKFRYCLERGLDPTPGRRPTRLRVAAERRAVAERDLSGLRVDGEALEGPAPAVLRELDRRVAAADPDVLQLSTGELVPLCHELADEHGVDLQLGRRPGWERLAGANTYESYGRVGHSPARYDVPGRVLIDETNSFLLGKSGLTGLLDLVARSHRPLQETARGSIGTILTAIEVREARERDVLVPWRKSEPEFFTDARTLHAADRGGFTYAPRVGLHEDVAEVDFSSLYPTIMVERNVSPETVCCDCHDTADVPELGYSVCEERGFLADVLEPLVGDRARYGEELARLESAGEGDSERAEALRAKRTALKWVLVSCFGYQGYRNAKFGRVEAHEAISAYAREILLEATAIAEDAGWEVVHGIVDSLWLRRADPDAEPVAAVCERVTDAVGIDLEHERSFDWIAAVPRRSGPGGALNRYFGSVRGGGLKLRGIECRQRSTTDFVAAVQRELIGVLDETRDPEAVCETLAGHRAYLRRGAVDPARLVVTTRLSKPPGAYTQRTLAAAAAARARRQGLAVHPGQDVHYVVVDGDPDAAERVRLADEAGERYDVEVYDDRLLRAAESVCSPLGWERADIEGYLEGGVQTGIGEYG